jgi:integrase
VASIKRRNTKRGLRYDVRYRTTAGDVRTRTHRTRRDAERFAVTVEADKHRGEFVDPRRGRLTLEEYSAEWLATRPKLRPRTRETYEGQLRLHVLPMLGTVELGKLTPSLVRRWHADLSAELGPNTVAKCYRLLRAILGTAVTDELVVRNPCRIERAGIERATERPIATVSQVWELADEVSERFRCLVLVAGFIGLRLGELLALERRHINLLHGTLTVEQPEHQLKRGELLVADPKSDAGRRTISLPPPVMAELERHLASHAQPGPECRLFSGEKGGPLRRHVWQKHWTRARGRVGLPKSFRFHDLRHTANTLAAASGASTAELMHRMGHASSAAALRYQHATRERDQALASALGELIAPSKQLHHAGSAS